MNNLGPRIKERRLALSMSLADVAKACDVAKTTVMRWEEGSDIRHANLLRLATVLQTTPTYLMGYTNVPERDVSVPDVMSKRTLFDNLVEALGAQQIGTSDGDYYIVNNGVVVEVDPDVIKETIDEVLKYFAYCLFLHRKA